MVKTALHVLLLLKGYIDIILKRRQRRERFGDDGNEEEAMEEDLVTPRRAVTMVGLPGMVQKKAEQSNVPLPGVLRNSGGKARILSPTPIFFVQFTYLKWQLRFAQILFLFPSRLCSLSLLLIYRRPS